MKAHRLFAGSALTALAFMAGGAQAADVHLGYAGLEWSPFGDSMRGTLRIEIRNVSNAEMRNVDVAIANPGVDSLERTLLQFGTILAGDVRVTTARFIFSTVKEDPLVWRVEYDQDGERKQAFLVGERQGGQP